MLAVGTRAGRGKNETFTGKTWCRLLTKTKTHALKIAKRVSPAVVDKSGKFSYSDWRGKITSVARTCKLGISHRKSSVAAKPPRNWAATNPGASAGRIPARVSLRDRAMVMAGLANDVEA